MKLRNKKTGQIIDAKVVCRDTNGYLDERECITDEGEEITLERLNKNWEDYEEPKEYFYIYADGDIYKDVQDDLREDNGCKEIGNYFETREEAEEAVEKLKAWKRLREAGFKFERWEKEYGPRIILIGTIADEDAPAYEIMKDLKIITKEKEAK